ncbi:uncharacterized protein LOC141902256 [Tubulanus polymorphus]|uniref:uncharacterized protein LOC141902256 n=1 Tax=Tubulanus polymorphus TaxID=672921 RepID=UPI003DA3DD39
MPKYTLKYFDARARAEISRLLFAQAGVEYEDVRYPMPFDDAEGWAKIKAGIPFGKVPVLEIDGQTMTQSLAIANYLAKEFGLLGNTAMETGRILEVFFTAQDIMEAGWKVAFEKDEAKKEEMKKTNMETEIPRLFGALSTLLGSNEFFVGSGVTLADLQVFLVTDGVIRLSKKHEQLVGFLDKFPTLSAHRDKIASIPKIATYLENRPKTTFYVETSYINPDIRSIRVHFRCRLVLTETDLNMPKYTLKYFNARGLAEISRLLFAQAGVEYEDVRYTLAIEDAEGWAKIKAGIPFGKVPVLEIDGQTLTQSTAIANYLAKEFGLLGNTAMETGRILEVFFTAHDIMDAGWKVAFEKDEARKEEMKKTNIETEMPRLFGALKTLLGSNEFFVGSGVTLADLQVFLVTDGVIRLSKEHEQLVGFLDKFPTLSAHRDKIASIPKIATYLENRPKTAF